MLDQTYRLIRRIGEGGMGTVFEATHARLAGRYAIKVLLEKLSSNAEALERFEREARVTSLLQHPNVVQVVDHNTTADGTEYLVMEYLAGESLADRLARHKRLPVAAVVDIVQQLAAGLAAAHGHGIVHRDLKPENVFLVPVEGRESELVKILDFGISKVKRMPRKMPGKAKAARWDPPTAEGALFGTPLYMAPEQIEGRVADVDAATDQFALAIMSYEMLTGSNPFRGNTVAEIFTRVLLRNPPATGLGRELDLVLRRGMAKASPLRFANVTDFAHALAAAAARQSTELASLGSADLDAEFPALTATGRSVRRSRKRFSSLVLIATAAAGLSMAFVVDGAAKRRSSPHVSAPATVPAAVMPAVTATVPEVRPLLAERVHSPVDASPRIHKHRRFSQPADDSPAETEAATSTATEQMPNGDADATIPLVQPGAPTIETKATPMRPVFDPDGTLPLDDALTRVQ